jgi:hypothetical protein
MTYFVTKVYGKKLDNDYQKIDWHGMARGSWIMDTCVLKIAWLLRNLIFQTKHHAEELFIVDCDNSVLIRVKLSERSCQCVEKNATLDEVIEENCSLPDTIEFSHQHLNQPIRQSITKTCQSRFQFVFVDRSRIVGIKAPETVLPVGNVSRNDEIFVIF